MDPDPLNRASPRTGIARRRLLRQIGKAALASLALAGSQSLLLSTGFPMGTHAARAEGSDFMAPVDDELRPIRIGVFGDSLADGIWAGLYRTLQRNDRFEVARHTEVSSGLARPDFFDWEQTLVNVLADETIDVAVVCFGLNDNQPVYYEGRRQFSFSSEEWNTVYNQRVSEFLATLTAADIPVFWVGLPTVRDSGFGEQMAHLNDIYAAQALVGDATFVSTFEITGDENGDYSAYLVDEEGRNRLMRANDGVHFTGRGYELIAKALLAAMKREIPTFPVDDLVNG